MFPLHLHEIYEDNSHIILDFISERASSFNNATCHQNRKIKSKLRNRMRRGVLHVP